MAIEVRRVYEIQNIGKGEIIDIQPENLLELWDRQAGELWRRGEGYNSLMPFYSPSQANGQSSVAIGEFTIADGFISFASGYLSQANGDYSHAEGYMSRANGEVSHAEGSGTSANGTASHAEGSGTTAGGGVAHSEGFFTRAVAFASHAQGYYTVANGNGSHSEGYFTTADADYSHAGGNNTQSVGLSSFVHGYDSAVNGDYSIVLGRGITGNTADTTYVDRLNVKTVGTTGVITPLGVDSTGNVVAAGNLQKIITGNYTLTNADNNYTILINAGSNPVNITIPSGLLAKIQIGFIQQGTGDVTFVTSGTTINTPISGAFKIKGQNYNAYLEQVGSTNVYHLLGNLKV